MKDRIKTVRLEIDKEKMTQEEFAKEIGVSKGAVWQYEKGEIIPSNATLKLICSRFGVNEQWLLTGEGEMRINTSDEDEIDKFCTDVKHLSKDDPRRIIMKLMARLPEKDWIDIANIISDIRNDK